MSTDTTKLSETGQLPQYPEEPQPVCSLCEERINLTEFIQWFLEANGFDDISIEEMDIPGDFEGLLNVLAGSLVEVDNLQEIFDPIIGARIFATTLSILSKNEAFRSLCSDDRNLISVYGILSGGESVTLSLFYHGKLVLQVNENFPQHTQVDNFHFLYSERNNHTIEIQIRNSNRRERFMRIYIYGYTDDLPVGPDERHMSAQKFLQFLCLKHL